MQALRSHEHIRDVNTRYHDQAAATYDAKWGIDFGEVGRSQVLGKVTKLLPAAADSRFASALEVGAGTGYFGLNLMRAGLVSELTCTDISTGMLDVLLANAQRLGLEGVSAVQCDSESLPFPDASFEIVMGHAVLHHLPDLERAFSEFLRVLRPGGLVLFTGEPSRLGDRLARVPKRAALALAPLWRRTIGAAPAHEPLATEEALATDGDQPADELEGEVDIHAFAPATLQRIAELAGFEQVTVLGEELVASWFGWFNRGLEASARPQDVPMWWRRYAFHGYLALQRLDRRALEPHLPAAIFYNLLLSARRPGS